MEVERISPALGAIVRGVDLSSQSIAAAAAAELKDCLVEHQVLFFPDQPLSPSQHRDLARLFGPLHRHPIYPHDANCVEIVILDTSDDNPPDSDTWHTDV